MTSNFIHMKSWPEIYDKLLRMEDELLEDKENGRDKNRFNEGSKHFMIEAYSVIDNMCQILIEANGITDDRIIEVIKSLGYPSKGGPITLSARITTLEKEKYILEDSAKKLNHIRITGALLIDDEYDVRPNESLPETAEEIYESLYHETYLFANQYIPEAQARANEQGKGSTRHNPEKKAAVAKSSVLGRVVTMVVIVLFILACVGLAIAIF